MANIEKIWRKDCDAEYSNYSSYDRHCAKFVSSLQGFLDGIYCDVTLDKREIIYLDTFLLENQEVISYSEYANVVYFTVKEFCESVMALDAIDDNIANQILEKVEQLTNEIYEYTLPLVQAVYTHDEFLVNYFHGFCKGLISDGVVGEPEVDAFVSMLADNEQLAKNPVVFSVYEKLSNIDFDNLSDADIDFIKTLITDFSGAAEDVTTGNSLGNSFFDEISEISLKNKKVVLTGTFSIGTRSTCENFLKTIECTPHKQPAGYIDYVIVGDTSSKNWYFESFGRKVELAKDFKNRGFPIKIISEQQWLDLMIEEEKTILNTFLNK